MMRHNSLKYLFIFIFCTTFSNNIWASKVLPLNIDNILSQAEIIFEGECINVRTGEDKDTGLLATWFTFKIHEAIKGDLEETFTFKQIGGQDEAGSSMILPLAHYHQGERVILFLYGESELGFSSAVGLHQGKFSITKSEDDQSTIVTNGMPASVLFKDMQDQTPMINEKGITIRGAASSHLKTMAKSDFVNFVKKRLKENDLVEK